MYSDHVMYKVTKYYVKEGRKETVPFQPSLPSMYILPSSGPKLVFGKQNSMKRLTTKVLSTVRVSK